MKAIVLCAGEGSRLYPFSDLIPKAMMPVGGKPVVAHILDRLRQYGFFSFVLCINKKNEAYFKDYFDSYAHRYGVQIYYSVSDTPLGTVGEVLKAKPYVEDDFLLCYGDTLTQIDFNQLCETHKQARKNDGVATLALVHNIPLEVGVVEWVPQNALGPQIIGFQEKPPLNKSVWSGIAILDPQVLSLGDAKIGDDFGADLFPRLIQKGLKLYGYLSDAEYFDVGTISHYRRVCKLAEEGKL